MKTVKSNNKNSSKKIATKRVIKKITKTKKEITKVDLDKYFDEKFNSKNAKIVGMLCTKCNHILKISAKKCIKCGSLKLAPLFE